MLLISGLLVLSFASTWRIFQMFIMNVIIIIIIIFKDVNFRSFWITLILHTNTYCLWTLTQHFIPCVVEAMYILWNMNTQMWMPSVVEAVRNLLTEDIHNSGGEGLRWTRWMYSQTVVDPRDALHQHVAAWCMMTLRAAPQRSG